MKFIPILFSTDMVQALLDNRKTMTRRLIKRQPENMNIPIEKNVTWGFAQKKQIGFNPDRYEIIQNWKCPYGQIGDVLWVREKHKIYISDNNYFYTQFENQNDFNVFHKEEISLETWSKLETRKLPIHNWKGCASLHMYKDFCRLFLEITNIRCERLQDISEDDAKNEGVLKDFKFYPQDFKPFDLFYRDYLHHDGDHACADAKSSFQTLWLKINGEASWEANPWVWVVEFKQIEKPTNFI